MINTEEFNKNERIKVPCEHEWTCYGVEKNGSKFCCAKCRIIKFEPFTTYGNTTNLSRK